MVGSNVISSPCPSTTTPREELAHARAFGWVLSIVDGVLELGELRLNVTSPRLPSTAVHWVVDGARSRLS